MKTTLSDATPELAPEGGLPRTSCSAGWLPPETAPKNETCIIGNFGWPWPVMASWCLVQEEWAVAQLAPCSEDEGRGWETEWESNKNLKAGCLFLLCRTSKRWHPPTLKLRNQMASPDQNSAPIESQMAGCPPRLVLLGHRLSTRLLRLVRCYMKSSILRPEATKSKGQARGCSGDGCGLLKTSTATCGGCSKTQSIWTAKWGRHCWKS